MNRFHRLLTRPLLFALIATGMVAAVGEPVVSTAELEQESALMIAPTAEAEPTMIEAELERSSEAARAEHAAKLRWLITLPHARNSCCRRPV